MNKNIYKKILNYTVTKQYFNKEKIYQDKPKYTQNIPAQPTKRYQDKQKK
jgi:hypothetical protein